MPDAVQTSPPPDPGPSSSDADAHLAQLHKMSTTAGVTNLGYVAVNHTAIVAALLGLASALAFFGWLLLVIPAVGIVFALVAIRQINDSSGTQTGKPMAFAGLALCILLGGGVIALNAMAVAAVRGDENGIAATLSQVGQFLHDGKYKEAYALFDDDFQNRVKFDEFESTWKAAQTHVGRVEAMEWNGVTPYFQSAGGSRTANTKAKLRFAKARDERFDVELRQVGKNWRVLRFNDFFPERKPAKKDDVFNI